MPLEPTAAPSPGLPQPDPWRGPSPSQLPLQTQSLEEDPELLEVLAPCQGPSQPAEPHSKPCQAWLPEKQQQGNTLTSGPGGPWGHEQGQLPLSPCVDLPFLVVANKPTFLVWFVKAARGCPAEGGVYPGTGQASLCLGVEIGRAH